jgi:hypothetical protein
MGLDFFFKHLPGIRQRIRLRGPGGSRMVDKQEAIDRLRDIKRWQINYEIQESRAEGPAKYSGFRQRVPVTEAKRLNPPAA